MSLVDNLIDAALEKGGKTANFSIVFPNGTSKKAGLGNDEFTIRIKSKEVYSQIINKGDLGLGEQYMLGNIDVEGDLAKAMLMAAQLGVNTYQKNLINTLIDGVISKTRSNSRHNSLKNVVHHYDLGNEFYEQWLDKTFTYSCAYFKDPSDTIDKAEEQKLEHICKKLQLKPGDSLVDVGCGWGSMLIYAAQKYKVKGYGLTLSKEQINYATKKVKELGLEKLVIFEFKDYRDLTGEYDKFVSIGMFEHVGKKYYDQFFEKVKTILKAGGLGLLHTIGMNRGGSVGPWADTYIFPGGFLPSPTMIFDSATKSNLVPLDFENLRYHYALTLHRWIEAYDNIFEKVAKEKGMSFARMWRIYLYSAEANFKAGNFQLYQLTFSNGNNNQLPLTRGYIYS